VRNIIHSLFSLLIFASVIPSDTFAADSKNVTPPPETKKLYRVVDKDGKVHYSDQPSAGAKEMVMRKAPSIKMTQPKIDFETLIEENEKRRDPNAGYYDGLGFVNLSNDGVVRNNGGTVTLTVSLDPELSKGHFIKFFIDGKSVNSQQKELTFTAKNIEYGPHTASFTVVSKTGSVVQKSEQITFNLLHVVRRNTNANSGNSNSVAANKVLRNDVLKTVLPQHPKVPTYDSMKKIDK